MSKLNCLIVFLFVLFAFIFTIIATVAIHDTRISDSTASRLPQIGEDFLFSPTHLHLVDPSSLLPSVLEDYGGHTIAIASFEKKIAYIGCQSKGFKLPGDGGEVVKITKYCDVRDPKTLIHEPGFGYVVNRPGSWHLAWVKKPTENSVVDWVFQRGAQGFSGQGFTFEMTSENAFISFEE